MTRTTAEILVDGVLDLPENLPERVEEAARLHLLDALGVGLAASRLGPASGLLGVARPDGPCTVLGAATGTTPADAALVNGTLVHSLEYDDTHTGAVMHGSSVLAPAVLAAAEAGKAAAPEVVRAFVAGWEVLVRLGLAAPSGFQRAGFQGTSVAGPVAGAVAVGLLAGLDREGLLDAVAVAASFSAGNFTFLSRGASSKAAQAGIAAQAAISAMQLVQGGITGARDVFEGDRGFFGLYADDPSAADRLRHLSGDLGSRWYLTDAAFKGVPCCHFLHPFVEAVAALGLPDGGCRRIHRILCRVPQGQETVIALPWAAKQTPGQADEARWSLPYVVALQAVRGRVLLSDFVGPPDAEVLAVAARVDWEIWPDSGYPALFPAEIEVEWTDGSVRTVTIDDVDGGVGRPWAADRVIEKFLGNCEAAGLPASWSVGFAAEVKDAGLPDLGSLRSLVSEAG
ncbi:MmgE/PrpD family protein [Pseudonocardia halophobica]|uniref:MmgE/Prp family protein n=1 Tax=Pseudonocardia halophobica TaxID=29401 RepID=A0A9W6L024_9PSEU|nr:MmgE/PrpD family protein [Pseudonocardia halophobica]GLL09650.1 MmgE/Prp family protein [Pseudonocardia halophobica]